MKIGVTRDERPSRMAADWRGMAPSLILAGFALLILCVSMGAGLAMFGDGQASQPVRQAQARPVKLDFNPAAITATDPSQLRPVSTSAAEALNAAMPISRLANPAATALFVPTRNMADLSRSLECLTTAIYYEAATEPLDGQRAVAQVVLNRVRHPSFPHTVCGVVFQGSDRTTGCQFSFTCDGAMARQPLLDLWTRARAVAAAALTGSVYAPVGWATHYHADYVSPFWAPKLTKLAVIGRHIFYRLPGAAGGPPSFVQRYAGGEPEMSALIEAAFETADTPANATAAAPSAVAPLSDRPILSQSGGVAGGAPASANGVALPEARPAPPLSTAPTARRWVLSRDQPLPQSNAPDRQDLIAAAARTQR